MRKIPSYLRYGWVILLAAVAVMVIPEMPSETASDESPAEKQADQATAQGPTVEQARSATEQINRSRDQDGAEGNRSLEAGSQDAVLAQIQEMRRLSAQPTLGPGAMNSDLTQVFVKQLDEAQRQLDEARSRLGGSSGAPNLDAAAELLAATRARLLAGDSATATQTAAIGEQISTAMDNAQLQIDSLRTVVAGMPNAPALLEELDRRQQELNLARARFSSSSVASGSQPWTDENISQLVQQGQLALDQARAKAGTLPNAQVLLEQIEAAQTRLDEAEEAYRADNETAAN